MNFLEFVNERNKTRIFNESYNKSDLSNISLNILKLFKKHIDGKVMYWNSPETIKVKDEMLMSEWFVVRKGKNANYLISLNYKPDSDIKQVYSIDLYNNIDLLFRGKATAKLTFYTLGNSIVYFLPIIWTVINGDKFNISKEDAIRLGRSVYKTNKNESFEFYVGALKYIICENLSKQVIDDTFRLKLNEGFGDIDRFRKKVMHIQADAKKDMSPGWEDLAAEYQELKTAVAGGKITTFEDLRIAMEKNQHIIALIDEETKAVETEFEEKRRDPHTQFRIMHHYVKMVINGTNNAVILCGAPGVGKTYNVKKLLKANNFVEGHNMFTIKGKCTPRKLYMALYEYPNKGQIILIDDADSLVGPKAPEDSINILKAALDSTEDDEGRLVTYGVSGKLLDDEGNELPKRFYYNGSIIVITNWNAGNIDTALKGRSFIQDLNFTVDETLLIIKDLLPAIDPEHLSQNAKINALEYLNDLASRGSDMEISIRTFGICAKIFQNAIDDEDFPEEDVLSMIEEQMKLQSARRGNKY